MLVKGQDERNLERQKIDVSFYVKQLEFNEYDEDLHFYHKLTGGTGCTSVYLETSFHSGTVPASVWIDFNASDKRGSF